MKRRPLLRLYDTPDNVWEDAGAVLIGLAMLLLLFLAAPAR